MTEPAPLICAECGNGFALPTQPGRVNRNGQRVQVNIVTATSMWCPSCIAKHYKPNKSIEAQERHRKEMADKRRQGWNV